MTRTPAEPGDTLPRQPSVGQDARETLPSFGFRAGKYTSLVLAVAASGIIGNLGYHRIRLAVEASRDSRGTPTIVDESGVVPDAESETDSAVAVATSARWRSIAREAIRLRCRDLGIAAVDVDALNFDFQHDDRYRHAETHTADGRIGAEVRIPLCLAETDDDTARVKVTLYVTPEPD